KYILVDEFQDTNYAQYNLIKLLASPENNLTVTGDDDQSIYKFRGASVSNILEFKKDFPDSQEVFITKNYRSGQRILDLSYEFIKLNNPERLEVKLGGKVSKKLTSEVSAGGVIVHLHHPDQRQEVEAVIGKIMELRERDSKLSWNDFALLARTNEWSETFAGGLKDAGVPYVWAASRGLYKKAIIMDVLSYFNLLDNYHESPSLYRILNLPIFKIKTADLVELNYWANRRGRSLYKILEIADTLKISEQSKNEIRKITGLIQKHSQLVREGTIHNVFFGFMEDSGYLKYLGQKDDQETRDNIFYLNQFAKKVKQFETATTTRARLSDFLKRIEMEQEAGDEGPLDQDLEAGPEAVKIMTIHKAKGLEFPYVFIVGMVDKRFPSLNRRDPIEIPDLLVKEILPSGDVHLQEERRLFYVACTRAREGLFFTSAEDYGGSRRKKLSRFLIESGLTKQLEKEVLRLPTRALDQIRETRPKVMTGEKAEFKIPRHFSFSQFVAFSKCPLQYKFQFAIRIPKRGHYTFSFGQTMHKVMYDLFHLLQNKEKIAQTDLFGFKNGQNNDKEISWETLKKIFENAWIDDWYPNEKTQKEYKRAGLKQLKEFYQKHKGHWPKVLGIEKAFRLKIGEDAVIGRIDRIDEVEGGVAIVDYKTGSARELKYLARENKEQLLLYQLSLQEVFNLEPKNLSFYYFENNQAISFLGKDKDLEKLKTRIAKIISRIKSADFTPTPGFQCKYCDFKEICEYRKL
ncbi:MAG: 3'-5' exonuclease, partial [bacterium]|nr:3'-5' exonuclease [bacterium]